MHVVRCAGSARPIQDVPLLLVRGGTFQAPSRTTAGGGGCASERMPAPGAQATTAEALAGGGEGGGGRWPVPHGVGRESTRNTGTYSTMHLSTCLPMVIQSSERSREPARLRSLMAVPAFYRRVSTLH